MTELKSLSDKGVKLTELIGATNNITSNMEKLKQMGQDLIKSSVLGFGLSLVSIADDMGKSVSMIVDMASEFIDPSVLKGGEQ